MVINKLVITQEAVFDYEQTLGLGTFPKDLKPETEEYIDGMNRGGRLVYDRYFRAKYLDERSGIMLMLFVYRSDKCGVMQLWNLMGVCPAEDYNAEDEYSGRIRNWLETKITDLDDYDWVVRQRAVAIVSKAVYIITDEIREAVKDEFEYNRDKEAALKLPFLQTASKRRSRRSGDGGKAEIHRRKRRTVR